ncbi:MAG: hypothetical protein RDV48_30375 [Candidatus Eremiobacteraeota bacterium]|nr:hypothetical protein [Candidatus Eremiobacteraeota bacterium]
MGIVRKVVYGRAHESMEEKIEEGLALTPGERHELACALSFHVLEVLKTQKIDPYEEEGSPPRSKRVIELPGRNREA